MAAVVGRLENGADLIERDARCVLAVEIEAELAVQIACIRQIDIERHMPTSHSMPAPQTNLLGAGPLESLLIEGVCVTVVRPRMGKQSRGLHSNPHLGSGSQSDRYWLRPQDGVSHCGLAGCGYVRLGAGRRRVPWTIGISSALRPTMRSEIGPRIVEATEDLERRRFKATTRGIRATHPQFGNGLAWFFAIELPRGLLSAWMPNGAPGRNYTLAAKSIT